MPVTIPATKSAAMPTMPTMPTMCAANEAYKLALRYGAEAPRAPKRLICARRDSAAFQLVVNSDLAYSLNVGLGDWYSARGGRRPDYEINGPHQRLRVAVDCPFPVEVRIEEFMTDDDGVKKADVLLSGTVRESGAGVPSAVWVEIFAPADALPGDYTVTARLYSALYNEDEQLAATVTLPLCVAAYTLPAPRDWKFYLDLWQHNSNVARKFEVPLWSEAHFAVLEKVADTLADLGQKAITVCVSEIPWSGQCCFENMEHGGNLFEYSMVEIRRDKSGALRYDFSKMQRYINLCTEKGLTGEIEVFGLVNLWTYQNFISEKLCADYPEPIRLRYLDEADGRMKYVRDAGEIENYIRALERYFKETAQIDRVRVAADEPQDVEKYRRSLALLRELAPAFRYKTAINHAEFIGEFGDIIDDLVPYLRCATKAYGTLSEYRRKYPGKRFLWYVCTGISRPNTFLRSPLTECRMIGPMTALLGFDGFLRWNYTVWPEDPRADIRLDRFEAGDTNFVYPARNGELLLSLRYKNLRRGIADFEIARALCEKCGNGVAKPLFDRLLFVREPFAYYEAMKAGNVELHTHDWEDFNAVKAEMLALLDKV